MKRSNFTFLFLFALLSFVSVNLGAQAGPQSSSCINEVNITVDAMCGFEVDKDVLGYTGAIMPQSIVYAGPTTNSGTAFPGTGSITALGQPGTVGLNIPHGGTVQYQLWSQPDGEGTMLCWGDINFEIKMTPEPEGERIPYWCGQPFPPIPTYMAGPCQAEITNITASEQTQGSVCDGLETIRTITGVTSLHGNKQTITLRTDTFVQSPLDTSMVECPKGGPDFTDAQYVSCSHLDGAYPSPDAVYEYWKWYYINRGFCEDYAHNEAIKYAYPYLDPVEHPVTDVCVVPGDCEWVVTDIPVMIEFPPGSGIWIPGVRHDSTYVCDPDEEYQFLVVTPLPKGTKCNLSVKCTDMKFPGCAGPESKIMRTWQILDWCNGSIKECMQWIVVEPDDPYFHEVMGYDRDDFYDLPHYQGKPRIDVEIAPWTCAAEIYLDAWVDWSCIADGSISWTSTIGSIGPDNVLRGLWIGEPAMVTATALGCHSLEEPVTVSFWVYPVNSIYPVPIAEDEVNVTLTHDDTGTVSPDGGVAKVFVDAIDAGSHNAGCGEVYTCLLLKEELLAPLGYLYQYDEDYVWLHGATSYGYSSYDAEREIYVAAGCGYDGVIHGKPGDKFNPPTDDIYFVWCKDYVKFCCSDIGANTVALLATNSGGHSAHSWSIVNVEDKSQAQYYCHPDVELDCADGYDPYDYAPSFASAICAEANITKSIVEDIDVCGNGYHIITWYLDGEAICNTYIEFDAESQFDPYEIKWPKHYTGENIDGIQRECEYPASVTNPDGYFTEYHRSIAMGPAFDCSDGGDTGEPVWCEAACSLVGSTYEPLEVEAADACKKIIKRWTVIDWCYWDPNTTNPDDDNDTAYDSFQAVDDEWLGAGEWYTSIHGYGAEGEYCEECDKTNAESDDVYFRYTAVDEDGYYTFDQVIKVIDEDAPVVNADPQVDVSVTGGASAKGDDFDDCYASINVPASVTDMCGEDDLATDGAAWWIEVYRKNSDGSRTLINSASKFGTDVTMNSGVGYPGDWHIIVWSVRDGCGNIGEAETAVYFQDDKQPTPVCIQDLSTAIMPTTGSVEIWASDYDRGSFDNCSEVSVYFLLDENGYPTNGDGTFSPNLNVTCQMVRDIGQGEVIVLGLYAVDAEGNYDFCNITLDINGAAEVCDLGEAASALIAGAISTELGDMVESAEVALNVGAKDITGLEGTYLFNGNAVSQSYEIKATKDDDYMNGVTTLDLVLTQKVILGFETFDSPYKVIAADINADGIVSARDLSELRKAILGQTARFPNNNSWRFVDAKQTFDNPSSPFPFLEVISISNLSENLMEEDFIAVKIGDVNGNAYANSALRGDARTAGRLALQVEDTRATAGELVEVTVGASNFDAISAYQFTMELSGLEFVSATSGSIEVNEYNFGLIDANTVTTAWTSTEGVSSSESLFTMTFRATADVTLSEALAISSRVTESMAYTTTQDRLDVSLEYNTVGSNGFVLLQNQPNPFDEVTYIGFELPVAGTAVFTVFDVTGKTISVTTDSYGAGYNEITLRKSDLGTTGVMYYQLESGDFTATKKMILID